MTIGRITFFAYGALALNLAACTPDSVLVPDVALDGPIGFSFTPAQEEERIAVERACNVTFHARPQVLDAELSNSIVVRSADNCTRESNMDFCETLVVRKDKNICVARSVTGGEAMILGPYDPETDGYLPRNSEWSSPVRLNAWHDGSYHEVLIWESDEGAVVVHEE